MVCFLNLKATKLLHRSGSSHPNAAPALPDQPKDDLEKTCQQKGSQLVRCGYYFDLVGGLEHFFHILGIIIPID